MNLNYSINAIPFAQMGIYVSDSDGVLQGLELKDPFSVDWPDAHGEVVDLSRPRFKARQIRLDCWMVANSADSFLSQQAALTTELIKADTQRLMLTPVEGKPLVFEVYLKGGLDIKKQWRDGRMFGQFTLNLVEPQPVKWVLRGTGNSTASIRLSAASPLTLFWGDGSKSEVKGVNQTLTHSYGGTSGALYYLIVAGELERMTFLESSNLTEIWHRLY